MKKILVTGSNGQVGSELQLLAPEYALLSFLFADRHTFDITNAESIETYLTTHQPNYLIHCAAYTAVDKAETEKEQAFLINATAPALLASACAKHDIQLLHLSTDFVFPGTVPRPLTETDITNPLSVYGQSKLQGERNVRQLHPSSIVIRTSWVYSSFGNNFVKTILRLLSERPELKVVADQIGTPTYARYLAHAILQIISGRSWEAGIYHYSNEGVASWYDFAIAIAHLAQRTTPIHPISTQQLPTPAQRPAFSVLNKTKIKNTFGIHIPHWQTALAECLPLITAPNS